MTLRHKSALCLAGIGLVLIALVGIDRLDHAYPPPLAGGYETSKEVLDRDGALLRAYALKDGRWRLKADLNAIDTTFIDMLIAYEDKRFWSHWGVDPLALLRASGQLLTNGRIISGGSTLSMQLARLVEPRKERSLGAKMMQMLRALQIERRYTKKEILQHYLTRAPYGGNLEGVRSAALAYFGREAKQLDVAEAALLVALPQLPEHRRPDRHPAAAEQARTRVLERSTRAGVIDFDEISRAELSEVPPRRHRMPAFAAHLADRSLRKYPNKQRHKLSMRKSLQSALENVALDAAKRQHRSASVAMVLADSTTGEILAHVGSANYFDHQRRGWLDMTQVSRSPGSTLKPLIYGLAFEGGIVAPQTQIEDQPTDFAGYRPRNFDMNYQGDVTVRAALQMSLNVPAIKLLEAVGPVRLVSRVRRAGIKIDLPRNAPPGLAIGLGGAGVTLEGLVQLYAAIAHGGTAVALSPDTQEDRSSSSQQVVLDERAAWHVGNILAGVTPPAATTNRHLAYKTGTSYGYRDAWAIGFDGKYVLGVWVGRADGGPLPGITGRKTAAPILFNAFARSRLPVIRLPHQPATVTLLSTEELPVTLRRFSSAHALPSVGKLTAPAPKIIFPPNGARIDLGLSKSADNPPLVLKLQGGRPPFRWIANGTPLKQIWRRRQATWSPEGTGYSKLTVIDAAGQATSVQIYIE